MRFKKLILIIALLTIVSCLHIDIRKGPNVKQLKNELKELVKNGVHIDFLVRDTKKMNNPRYIAINALKGYIFISETGTNSVHIFNVDGKFLKTIDEWENRGDKDYFNYPEGLAIDVVKEQLYVVDCLNNRILKFEAEGEFIGKFPPAGENFFGFTYYEDDEDLLNLPGDIYIDSMGKIYLVDTYNHRVIIYDNSGKKIRELGGKGNIGGLFNFPRSVCVDHIGNIFVCEDSGRIQVFNSGGTYLYTFSTRIKLEHPHGMDIWKENVLMVCDTGNKRIIFYSTTGNYIYSINSTMDGRKIEKPYCVRTDNYNNIYILDSEMPGVYKIFGY